MTNRKYYSDKKESKKYVQIRSGEVCVRSRVRSHDRSHDRPWVSTVTDGMVIRGKAGVVSPVSKNSPRYL